MTLWLAVAQDNGGMWHRLGEGLSLMVVGMLVVFVALCLTATVIVCLNRIFTSDAATSSTESDKPSTGGALDRDAHLRVVLAAAASVVAAQRVRIVKINSAKPT